MRIALVAGAVPSPTASGSTLTTYGAAKHFLAQGHEVVVALIGYERYEDPLGETLASRTAAFEALGGRVEVVPSQSARAWEEVPRGVAARARRLASPDPRVLFPTLADRAVMDEALRGIAPDAVFAYHWEALAATHGFRGAPRLGGVGDPHHLSLVYRWRASLRRPSLWALSTLPIVATYLRGSPRAMVEMLRDCESAGAFAGHHARWFREHGVPGCRYLPTPLPDPFADGETRTRSPRNEKPRLLLMGHLKGTSTLEGLGLFARDVLPRLEEALGPDGFEVRVVGGYDPDSALAQAFDRPSVRFCGHTADPGAEFLGADMIVVPTPIKLGTRVRILTAFSYGCPIVAHEANALGIPELAHRENAMLGGSGAALAESILEVVRDGELRARLEQGSRATFERYFSPAVAGGALLTELQRIAG